MTRQRAYFTAMLVVVSLIVIGLILSQSGVPRHFSDMASYVTDYVTKSESVLSETVRVKRVIDGDTIELENGERVRYIGVNAPESVKPNAPVECFGHEASAYNRSLVEGNDVRLEKDVSERDKYGRLLRYVYVGDVFVNAKLVEDGYAHTSSFPPDVARQDLFRSFEREARAGKRGLWADDTCGGKK